ncbi:hypothetical protein RUM44_007008 [Polyplax serrata]|uniref:Pro-resilin n=1 Tax=Polyplax serrata TaxID=468196 RepID=A0ABR1B1D7_POLSC
MATKIFIWMATLLVAAVAEPPVPSTYLPPGARGSLSRQYGPPQGNGFGDASNDFRTAISPSYLPPPANNVNGEHIRDGGVSNDQRWSNTYNAPVDESNSGDFGDGGVTIDSASNVEDVQRRPASTYGVPNGFDRSVQESGFQQPSFATPSGTHGVPRNNAFYTPSGRSPNRMSNSFGAALRSPQSGFGSSAMMTGRVSATYGAPARSSFGPNAQGHRASSSYSAPSSQSSNRYTSAIPSNSFGKPFNSAADNNFAAPLSTYGSPSNEQNSYSGQYSNEFSENQRKPSTEDPLAEPAKYEYNYEVQASEEHGTEFGHKENRENELARGVYHVLLPDGRMQIVEYEADERGYRPQIRYEETGYPDARSGHGGY